jgi:hypothetical protein
VSLDSEAALMEIGLRPVFDGNPRFNQEQAARAARLTKRARAMVLRFLSGSAEDDEEPQDEPAPPFDWKAVSEQLQNLGDKQSAGLTAALPEPLADEVSADVTRIADNLQRALPRRVTKSTVKATVQPPGVMELGRFRRRWAVATDPLIVLRDLVRGSISPDQVEALSETYPEFFKALTSPGGIVDDAIATMKARRGDNWDIPISRDRTLRVLLQAEPLNLALAADYQRVAQAQAQQAAQMPGQGPTTKPLKIETNEELPGQKVA